LVTAATAVTVLAVLGISIALHLVEFSDKTWLMLELLRLMFPYMLLACLAAVLIGMANARGHFFVPALGAVMLNVIMIASVLLLAPSFGPSLEVRVFGLAVGVVLAGMAQAIFQLPSLTRDGYRYQWVSPWHDPTVREVVRKMLPASLGVAAFQVNVLVTQTFSFWFDESIVSTFNYSVRLMELPQGMFGISLATFLLPTLSGLAAEKKYPEFRQSLGQGLSYLSFANLIAAAIAFGLAEPIVRLIFERGKFGPDATHRVAIALACLAPGLLMFSMNNILARAFFALNDIKTPMKISIVCLGLNLVFALWLVKPYREAGLAVANTLSAAFNTLLLAYALRRKLSRAGMTQLIKTLTVLAPTALVAGLVASSLAWFWEKHLGHRTFLVKLGAVFVPGTAGVLIYWSLSILGGVTAAKEITTFLMRAKERLWPASR
jgi:putative peptidoglycan lipid II flippase